MTGAPTPEQREIIETIQGFVDREVRPTAAALELADDFPDALVATMREPRER